MDDVSASLVIGNGFELSLRQRHQVADVMKVVEELRTMISTQNNTIHDLHMELVTKQDPVIPVEL